MATKAEKQTKQQERALKQSLTLDTVVGKLLDTIDTTHRDRMILSRQDAKIQKIIADELDLSKGISNGSIIDFVSAAVKQEGSNRTTKDELNLDTMDLFTREAGDIYGYFQQLYKNRYLEIADLKFITKFIPALGEAVKTTLDAITNSDDVSSTITRNLVFDSSLSKEEQAIAQREIERLEKEYKLPKRLRNTVFRKTLVTGQHYVYAVSYDELFNEYESMKQTGRIAGDGSSLGERVSTSFAKRDRNHTGFNIGMEAALGALGSIEISSESILSSAMESYENSEEYTEVEKKELRSALEEMNLDVKVSSTPYLTEAIEAAASRSITSELLQPYRDTFGTAGVAPVDFGYSESSADVFVDGVSNSTTKPSKPRRRKYNASGTYIKYIDAKNLAPLTIYGQTLGYYYVHTETKSEKKNKNVLHGGSETSPMSFGTGMFGTASLNEMKRKQAVQTLVDTITNGILDKFTPGFVNKNAEFKQLIADCIVSNGLVNNEFNIQFIPAHHIVPFIVNETDEGTGESMLADSLFPAKLLLSLIISKMLTYMNKSANKTMAYVKKGPIDANGNNHVQRVIRMLQESTVTFNDLLSTNLVFSKVSRDANMQIPTARDGTRLIDFEVQEGQQIDMKPEFEDWLEKSAIMGSGVPSVIMEYTDAADYSKSIVTGQIKFAGRVSAYDGDLEEPTTTLYKILIANSTMDDGLKQKLANGFEYKLPRPRVGTNANISDYVQTIYQSSQTQADIYLGQGSGDPDADKIRNALIKKLAIKDTPFLDWEGVESMLNEATLEVASKVDLSDHNPPADSMAGSSSGGNSSDDNEDFEDL